MRNNFSKNYRLFFALALTVPILLSGCDNDNDIPDVSKIKISLQTYRFDKDLYAIDTNNLANGLQTLLPKYPDFLDYYLDTVRAYAIHGNYNDTVKGIREDLKLELTFNGFRRLQDTIELYYPDTKDVDKELEKGFKFLKHYFPNAVVPRIFYVNMGLSNWPTFPVDNNTFCIGLDMFLGDQYPFYASIGVPVYMLTHCRKSYIPVSVFSSIYRSVHPFTPTDKTLLDLMLQRGREQYYLHKILPQHPDSVLFGFTQTQLNWCQENEALIYNFFIHQKLIYNKDGNAVLPYVNDGPFAKGLEAPDDPVKYTPGNIGTWLGYRIVCNYMEKHPETTLTELVEKKFEPSQFLDAAKYRPK